MSADSLLLELLATPTAPFRERQIVRRVTQELDGARVPWHLDAVGNIVVGAASAAAYARLLAQARREPLRLFIAHMDHPGCHGAGWQTPTRLVADWHGGAPVKHLRGARIWLADGNGYQDEAAIVRAELAAAGRMIARLHLRLSDGALHARYRRRPRALFGGFGFRAPVWQAGPLLYTKAADDLIGVYAIVRTACALWAQQRNAPFIGLLTRAEEVGFVGAIGHLESGFLAAAQRPLLCISLEASRTLPGAAVGSGPVVRLGDRSTVFSAGPTAVLTELAQEVLPDAHQRRIMDGGSCEATAATVYGLPAIGLSVPLGNYHNQSFEGGPDSARPQGPAPEFVHAQDIEGLCTLCLALMRPGLPWAEPWARQRQRLRARLKQYRPLLRA